MSRSEGESAAPNRAHDGSGAPEIWKGFTLSPFQREAIAAIRSGHNVLVSAPTGAGKTLVAEYAIVDAVQRGRRCIFTAPIKALSNQKYRDFRDDPQIDVGLMTGDVTIHPTAQVLIMTTEILRNAIFESPESLADVEYVIFDEVHFMDDRERGTVWEESLVFSPKSIRFIALSATISNLEELGDWLTEIRDQEVTTVKTNLRPVPLHFRFYTERSGSFEPKQLGKVRKDEEQSKPPKGQSRAQRRRRGGRRGGRGSSVDNPNIPPNTVPLFDELFEANLMPALVFCFSRKDCERLARRGMQREFLNGDEYRKMVDLQQELIEIFQLEQGMQDGEIFQMARHGVGYHHAGMLPAHKEVVERFFTSGLIKLLITTETFAVGINMPARTVVFNSLRKFDGINFDYMRTRDFLQMAGRAGRQGIDTEGIVYTLLSPRDLQEAPVERLLKGEPEPIESRFKLSFASLLHLTRRLGRERVHEAWEKSFNSYQHRDASRRQREHNRKLQARLIDSHLAYLDELGYLEGDALLPRGRFAQSINGYELQVTELLFRGLLEDRTAEELAVIFVGLIHEERRTFEPVRVARRLHGDLRRDIDDVMRKLTRRAIEFDLPTPPKRAEWGLTPAVMDWVRGCPFDELEGAGPATPGDICRAFRMGIQLMRQTRRAIDKEWSLYDQLGEAMECLNRDEVDARLQLELG
ncbi:MAG: superfamily II RNA helicase [Planctomycetota bacterium]|jgi:superfamily II RNA helicase